MLKQVLTLRVEEGRRVLDIFQQVPIFVTMIERSFNG
jgi:hypothetical protein